MVHHRDPGFASSFLRQASTILFVLGYASSASAIASTLTVDATRSVMTMTGAAIIDYGFPGGASVSPFQSQLAFPSLGATGGTIADGSTSDGLFTSISGSVAIEQTGSALQLVRADLTPDVSGQFTPTFGGFFAGDAQLAGTFVDTNFGIDGEAAIRFGDIELVAAVLRTSVLGNVIQLGAGSRASSRFVSGSVDYHASADSSGGFGATIIPQIYATTELAGGQLAETTPGQGELVLPFTASFTLTPAELPLGIPLSLQFDFTGQIVATGAIAPIPEPSTALLVGLGLAVLTARPWTGARRP